MSDQSTRAGTVAILGRPNAGKSTLMNQFLGEKLSIVSPKAQTTRRRVRGVDTRGDTQIIFIDTPGLLETRYLLQEAMLEEAMGALGDVDVCLLLVDPTRRPVEPGDAVLDALRARTDRVVGAVNKVDALSDSEVKTACEEVRSWFEGAEAIPIFPISAASGANVDRLRERIAERLPESPFLYPPDELSDLPVRFFVAELVRESAFELFGEEVPYSIAVTVDEFREGQDPIYIGATIHVERSSQKGIVIGERGAMIKRFGAEARNKIEGFLGVRIYLDLWVKVLPKWRKRAASLRRLGYPVPDQDQR